MALLARQRLSTQTRHQIYPSSKVTTKGEICSLYNEFAKKMFVRVLYKGRVNNELLKTLCLPVSIASVCFCFDSVAKEKRLKIKMI